jgi:5'-nucleotidase
MLALVTNDDGIGAPGLCALLEELQKVAEVFLIAPEKESSASSHSLTINGPIGVKRLSENVYVASGTPSDCVYISLVALLKKPPDICIAGINRGANVGEDIIYSGTVSAAMEATFFGVPSFAISVVEEGEQTYKLAAKFSINVANFIMEKGLPKGVFLNINVPPKPKGVLVTVQGEILYKKGVKRSKREDREYFWLKAEKESKNCSLCSDAGAISNGFISITPLHTDFTCYSFTKNLKDYHWSL